ncbi:MAG TPA: hypothetical protein VFV08_12220 [Puia sp.]|nr:hypothetical protein [Puia sp.]
MNIQRICLLFFFLMLAAVSQAQSDSSMGITQQIAGDIVDFSVDNLGNIYLLSSNNQLKKLSPQGDSLAVYNDVRRFGQVYNIDVTNPLKILVFYREFGTIVELDRFLHLINPIDLRSLGIFQAKAVGLAYDNNIWIYDELDAKLKRVGDDGTLIDQTTDLRQFADPVPEPQMIIDQGGFVYLYDSTKGVYNFDYYGAFQKHLPFIGWRDFSVIDKNMLGWDQHYFFRYQFTNPEILRQPIPSSYLPASKILIMPGVIYVLKSDTLEIYSKK